MCLRVRVGEDKIVHCEWTEFEALYISLRPISQIYKRQRVELSSSLLFDLPRTNKLVPLTSFLASSSPFRPSRPLSRITSLTGAIAAFLHVSLKSLPLSPSVRLANSRMLNAGSGASFVWLSIKLKILRRWSILGRRMGKRLGIRRRMAGSMSFGRFVAPRTRIRDWGPVVRPSQSLRFSAVWVGKARRGKER